MYNDICKEIEMLELRLEDLLSDREYLINQMHSKPSDSITASYSGMPGVGHSSTPLDVHFGQLVEIDKKIDALMIRLEQKKETKKRIEKKMSQLETVEGRVKYMHRVKGMKLYEVADELGYSYQWIRQINSRAQ